MILFVLYIYEYVLSKFNLDFFYELRHKHRDAGSVTWKLMYSIQTVGGKIWRSRQRKKWIAGPEEDSKTCLMSCWTRTDGIGHRREQTWYVTDTADAYSEQTSHVTDTGNAGRLLCRENVLVHACNATSTGDLHCLCLHVILLRRELGCCRCEQGKGSQLSEYISSFISQILH